MATGQRGFRELDISISSVLSAHERFPASDDHPVAPEKWRNTLTALSQYHNLYFIAIGPDLHIYKPQYPSQRLLSRPDHVVPLPFTGQQPYGAINPYNPHAANHVKVGDLGNEELLVCTCDDGDVIAFTTRSLLHELEILEATQLEAKQRGVESLEFISTVRPFFHCNVRESAWGIAIHKEARLIAISANTHIITVFAFALRQESSPDSPQKSSQDIEDDMLNSPGQGWQVAGPSGLNPDRKRDQITLLRGHSCNIPSISFCNTEDDPTGRYLISMDIKGSVGVWRIFEGTFQYNTSQQVAEEHGIPVLQNPIWHGWNLLCLNPRSFLPLKREVEIFGCKVSVNRGDRSWDITHSQQEVTDSSMSHPSYNGPAPGLIPLHLPVLDRTTAEDDEGNEEEGLDEDDDSEDEMDMDIELLRENLRPSLDLNPPHFHSANPASSSADHTATTPPLPLLLLTCSTTTPTLWSPNSLFPNRLLSPHAIPATHLTHMLDQRIPASHHWLHQHNRLNMSLQIPTLGIVILASPMGRVALLTLTRHGRSNRCAFRLDWLLPFRSQEERGERPDDTLVGIAVGPVQGSGPEPRRWRLMLTYRDYSVLSYEIWRRAPKGLGDEVLVF